MIRTSLASAPLRVLAADATPVFREGLRAVIDRTVGLEWAGGTDHADAIRRGVRTIGPRVVVLDSAVDPTCTLIRDLVEINPELMVAVLFRDHDRSPASVRVAQSSGARCLLSRDTEASVMVRALLQAHQTGRYVDPRLTMVLSRPWQSASACDAGVLLTARQRQILALVAQGMSEPDIARHLDLGAATVSSHMKETRRRLGARDRAHAVALAYHVGVLPLRPALVAQRGISPVRPAHTD
ncbi:DNA-binding response regulator, NarL/FixJ family, contains REC and HTH domains [Lentzea albidocapillata subsp. violacea]|uniref:DNA-binding response regulator, NarL/FixJ family, contains REC and HTH domains n=1 Tax=Lentzea albidocapillata subsp. violacea TaxID=128104 RepID=A0A1G8YEU3_9PSEU|nr:response regulator transcription factor [Lentzea albidocapillata]SDK00560.1 DNA-binding response regulator, NarL/FixJ family, contains REC and HTH domains [Lentzea albidocapillata subsp. violacea]